MLLIKSSSSEGIYDEQLFWEPYENNTQAIITERNDYSIQINLAEPIGYKFI